MFKNRSKKYTKGQWIGVGIALGVAFGAAINNVGLGIVLGLAIGSAADAYTIKKLTQKENLSNSQNDKSSSSM